MLAVKKCFFSPWHVQVLLPEAQGESEVEGHLVLLHQIKVFQGKNYFKAALKSAIPDLVITDCLNEKTIRVPNSTEKFDDAEQNILPRYKKIQAKALCQRERFDEGPSLETLNLAFCILAVHQPFIFRFVFQHCLRST